MFGWLSAASTCASRLKRASRSGSTANEFGEDLERDVAIRASCRARDRPRPCRPSPDATRSGTRRRASPRATPQAPPPGRGPPPLRSAPPETPRRSARAPAAPPPPDAALRHLRMRPPRTPPARAGRDRAPRRTRVRHAAGVRRRSPRVSVQLTQQPEFRQPPVAFDGVSRHMEHVGRFLHAQASEKP